MAAGEWMTKRLLAERVTRRGSSNTPNSRASLGCKRWVQKMRHEGMLRVEHTTACSFRILRLARYASNHRSSSPEWLCFGLALAWCFAIDCSEVRGDLDA